MFHRWLFWQIESTGRQNINPETRWYANWQWPERLWRGGAE